MLLIDNAPGHFPEFVRGNIKVMFLPPNCTAWKQPCDLGIIAALKKRYKFLYLKDVLEFYELNEDAKKGLKFQEKSQRKGAAGVAYGKPAHLLDAARYLKQAWSAISPQTIKNAFQKADLKIWNQAEEEPSEEIINLMEELVSGFKNLKVSLSSEEIEGNIQQDHIDHPEYQAALGKEVDAMLEEHMPRSSDCQPSTSSSGTSSSQADAVVDANFDCPTSNSLQLACFEKIFKSSLEIDSQLASIHAETVAGPHFDVIKTSFEQFQKNLKKGMKYQKDQRQKVPKKQLTLLDMLKK